MKFREVSNDIADIADAAAAISDPGAQTGRIDALQEMLTPLQEQLQTLRSRVERDCSEEQCLEIRCNDIAKVNKQLLDLNCFDHRGNAEEQPKPRQINKQ